MRKWTEGQKINYRNNLRYKRKIARKMAKQCKNKRSY
jgi:hypothetical protein